MWRYAQYIKEAGSLSLLRQQDLHSVVITGPERAAHRSMGDEQLHRALLVWTFHYCYYFGLLQSLNCFFLSQPTSFPCVPSVSFPHSPGGEGWAIGCMVFECCPSSNHDISFNRVDNLCQVEMQSGGKEGQSWQVSNINLPYIMQNKGGLFQNDRIGNEALQIQNFLTGNISRTVLWKCLYKQHNWRSF